MAKVQDPGHCIFILRQILRIKWASDVPTAVGRSWHLRIYYAKSPALSNFWKYFSVSITIYTHLRAYIYAYLRNITITYLYLYRRTGLTQNGIVRGGMFIGHITGAYLIPTTWRRQHFAN